MDEAAKIKNTDIVNELKLPPVKIHCSVLAEDAIKAALQDYQEKWTAPEAPLGARPPSQELGRQRTEEGDTTMALALTERRRSR